MSAPGPARALGAAGNEITSESSRAERARSPRTDGAEDKSAELNIGLNGAIALTVFVLGGATMIAVPAIAGPMFHTILDTSVGLVTAVLALLFWNLSGRTSDPFPRLLALTFLALTACEVLHALAALEAAAGTPGTPSEVRWRAGTWGPTAHLLPISLSAILLMPPAYRRHTWLFALGLLLVTAGLVATFQTLPRYTPGTLGITRPSLILAPLLWLVVGASCWRLRQRDVIMKAIAIMSIVMVLAYCAMLFSGAPNDLAAMIAHWGKLIGRFFLLMTLVQMGATEMVVRMRTERELQLLNRELEQRVRERTAEMAAANNALMLENSHRERAERELREQLDRLNLLERFKDLLEAAPDAMVIVNQAGEIVIVNSQTEKLFGYTRSELLGRKIEMLVPPRFRINHPSHRDGFFAAPNARPMGADLELYGQRKDGSEFPLEISLSPLETEGGTLVSSAIRDITERKLHESALRRKNAELQVAVNELDAFSYSVSHDLRAPLRSIDAFSQILLKECGPILPEGARGHLQRVLDNTARMGHLVDDLLKFAHLGRQPLSKREVPVARMVALILHDIRQAGDKSTCVSVGDLPAVRGDPALLRQVFSNLIDNAFKYSRQRTEPAVEIGAHVIDGEQVFFVRDNGAGFDMQYADKLFGVFQRLHRREDFEGTGVGLAIVKRIVERHGGRIWAEAAVDKGATFYFTTEGASND